MTILPNILISIILIGLFVKLVSRVIGFEIELNEKSGFKFLIGWIIFGFLARLDYSDRWGCIVQFEPIFEPINILFSTISFGLVFWAFKTNNKALKKILCLTELMYWVAKLLVFKGGYSVGFIGGVEDTILFYDLIAFFLRLFVLGEIINLSRIQLLKTSTIVLLVFGIKSEVFPTQISIIYEEYQSKKRAKEIRKEMIGKWEGSYQKMEYAKKRSSGDSTIEIDSTNIKFNSVEGLEEEYPLNLKFSILGTVSKNGDNYESHSDYGFRVDKIEKDSLVFSLIGRGIYKFKLKKEEIEYQSKEKAAAVKKEIIGKWKGSYQKIDHIEKMSLGDSNIEIDSTSIKFNNVEGLEEEYQLNINSSIFGRISKDGDNFDYDLTVNKIQNNLLVFRLSNIRGTYEFILKKENEN